MLCKSQSRKRKHRTSSKKPLEIIEDIITWCSLEGDIILDPYLGSGSVAVACQKLKRDCIGIEIEEKYVKLTEERLSKEISQTKIGGHFSSQA